MRKFLDKLSNLLSVYLVTIFAAGISFYNFSEYRETGIITTAHGQQAKGAGAIFITYGLLACTFVLVVVSIYKTFTAFASQQEEKDNNEQR